MIQFRYEWINDVNIMQQEMSRFLDHFAGAKPPIGRFSPTVWEPAVDLYETDDDLVVAVELAGVSETDFELVVEGNVFTIRGQRRKTLSASKSAVYHQMEISSGPFERSINLPEAVDAENANASYENGLVVIVLPKVKKEQSISVGIRVK